MTACVLRARRFSMQAIVQHTLIAWQPASWPLGKLLQVTSNIVAPIMLPAGFSPFRNVDRLVPETSISIYKSLPIPKHSINPTNIELVLQVEHNCISYFMVLY